MPYTFTSPTTESVRPRDKLFRHVRQPPRGRHVIRESGTWKTLGGEITNERATAADAVLWGGHESVVSDAYAAELIAAGYSANLSSTILDGPDLWYRCTELEDTWVPTDGLPNSGSGAGPASLVTSPIKAAVVGEAAISLVDHANGRGVQVNYTADAQTRESFSFSQHPSIGIDADGSGMWTIDFTTLVDPTPGSLATTKLLDWYEGANIIKSDDPDAPAIGGVIEWVDSLGIVAAYNDDTLTSAAAVTVFERPDEGSRHQLSMRFDRDAGLYSHWWDGESLGTVDISSLGSLYGGTTPFLGNRLVLHNLRFDRDNDAFADPESLHLVLAATGT